MRTRISASIRMMHTSRDCYLSFSQTTAKISMSAVEPSTAFDDCFAMAATPNQTISTKTLAYSWPMQVSQRYIVLISERRPEALVVLAHYCVMLKMIDSLWFMEGCAVRILEQCRKNLEPKWHHYIEWPLSVIGA